MKLIMTFVTPKEAIAKGYKRLIYPKYKTDMENISKVQGSFYATITQPRNIDFHRKLFAVAECCIENGILLKLPEKTGIKQCILEKLLTKYKDKEYTLVYIAKYFLLPLEEEILPDGTINNKVASINFQAMDNLAFTEFYNKFIIWASDILECDTFDLENESVEYL